MPTEITCLLTRNPVQFRCPTHSLGQQGIGTLAGWVRAAVATDGDAHMRRCELRKSKVPIPSAKRVPANLDQQDFRRPLSRGTWSMRYRIGWRGEYRNYIQSGA
jgi:hypothetical protein